MINFNDFDIEEQYIDIGDLITIKGKIHYYEYNENDIITRLYYTFGDDSLVHVMDKKLGKDIREDGARNKYPNGLPYDGYLYMFKGFWPWIDISGAHIEKVNNKKIYI